MQAKALASGARPAGGRRPYVRFFGRFFTGITNFKPDHTSVTAHTFTSTSPSVKAALPHDVFCKIGRDARTFLWPRDPQHSGGRQRLCRRPQFHLQARARLGKEENEVEIFTGNALDFAFRKCAIKLSFHVLRNMKEGNAKILFDAQFLRQRSSGISRHVMMTVRRWIGNVLRLRSVISATGAHLQISVLRKNFDRAVAPVRDKIRRLVRDRVLTAQLFLNGEE